MTAAVAGRVPAPRSTGRDAQRLASVPAQGGPGRPADAEGSPDRDPLCLGRAMRLRLLAAVRALLADPSLEGLGDAALLSAVVLYAKSRAPRERRDDLQSWIRGPELARWLGMSESTVHHQVLPALRGSRALRTRVVTDAQGRPTGLDCLVMPLWNAWKGVGARHPLALSKAELATLLRLIEALFGPGWAPKGRPATPAGLLAGRTGKGAATDRLGLLLLVLNTRASGWLQLCGGAVKAGEGRGAATVARLLNCSPAGGRKVLARLVEAGVVARQRKETPGTRMRGRGRVMLLPVARAYGRVVAPVEAAEEAVAEPAEQPAEQPVEEAAEEAAEEAGQGAVQGSGPVFSQRPDTAVGDHGRGKDAGSAGEPGGPGAETAEEAEDRERPDTAAFHAVHAPVVTAVSSLRSACGFSGVAGGGPGDLPERACGREDRVSDGEGAAAGAGSPSGGAGPLRGEKPQESPVDEQAGQPPADTGSGARPAAGTRPQRGAGLPEDHRLRVALAPVAGLWAGLSGWQRGRVRKAVAAELERLAGLSVGPDAAPGLLAGRLTDRLEETGGEALVASPFGWLIRRGLVQRPACSDRRCDDGIRLDTGGECGTCGNVLHIRRAWRARISAELDAQMPGLDAGERRRILEERLREQAALEAEDLVWRREQAAVEQARREAARQAAQERAMRERAAAAAAAAVRQALPCEDCGQERAAGLCEACGYRRRTEALIVETCLVAATWSADLDDPADVAAVAAEVRASLEAGIATARREFLALVDPGELDADPAAAASALAFAALQAVEQAAPEYRSCALAMLARVEEAEAEARRAYITEQNRRWFRANPAGADAVAAATAAAGTARHRTAEYLLQTRLEHLRGRSEAPAQKAGAEEAGPAVGADRLAGLAARPLAGEPAGAVIA
jgi:hypothetical protein